MTREEMDLIRGFVANIQSLKDAHNIEQLPINYGTICTITAKGWELIKELKKQELCEDVISRKETLEALEQEEPLVWCDGADEIAAYNQWSSDVDTIKNIPSVQPKIGQWIDYSDEGYVECPFCGHATNCEDNIDELHYCFSCGAKMIDGINDKKLSEIPTGLASKDKCKKCEYYRNPDYERCHKCKAESEET